MSAHLLPVLTADDPVAALDWFGAVPGLTVDRVRNRIVCGDDLLGVARNDASDPAFRAKAFDHLAFQLGDVDGFLSRMLAAGALLDSRFTPAGPAEIAAFWQRGVRYVFLVGPGGVPVEFCERLDAPGLPEVVGLDHLGLRCRDVEAETEALTRGQATSLARHRLDGGAGPVNVHFLGESGLVWELFDEPPLPDQAAGALWAGVTPA